MTPMKNVERTNPSSDRQADNNDFIGPCVYWDSIYKENLTISIFWIYFWFIAFNWSGHA